MYLKIGTVEQVEVCCATPCWNGFVFGGGARRLELNTSARSLPSYTTMCYRLTYLLSDMPVTLNSIVSAAVVAAAVAG